MKFLYAFLILSCAIFTTSCCGEFGINRHVSKISNYSREPGNAIVLGIRLGENNVFKGKLDVQIHHGKNEVPWSNLVFGISANDSMYCATSARYSFKGAKITSQSPDPFQFEIDLQELDFRSASGKNVSRQEVISVIQHSKSMRIWAAMYNPGLLKNPVISTLLEHSGHVEITFK